MSPPSSRFLDLARERVVLYDGAMEMTAYDKARAGIGFARSVDPLDQAV